MKIGKKIIETEILRTIEIKLEYAEKMEYFIKALEKTEEKSKIDELYKDTLNLYFNKKDFSLLISLFLKIYTKKDLCNQLLTGFKKMNEDESNLVRKSYLKKYENDFIEIKSESKKLIEINNYNPIEFFLRFFLKLL